MHQRITSKQHPIKPTQKTAQHQKETRSRKESKGEGDEQAGAKGVDPVCAHQRGRAASSIGKARTEIVSLAGEPKKGSWWT